MIALSAKGWAMMPNPRTSIRPAMDFGARAQSRPRSTVSSVRSSATSLAPPSIRRSARSDLPAPLSPKIKTPLPLIATQLAWMLALCMASDRDHGQFDHKARAGADLGGFAGDTVFRPDAATGILRDLPRDGETQAGILAEGFAGPFGVEALENGFQIVRRNAGPGIFHRDAG